MGRAAPSRANMPEPHPPVLTIAAERMVAPVLALAAATVSPGNGQWRRSADPAMESSERHLP
jgi:hypothetical protein